jgi:chitinase
MTYDLMNRRDNETKHHTSVQGSLETIETYLDLGLPAEKANLGFAFYTKYFTTADGVDCSSTPLGCQTAVLEAADGTDTGLSGALTFEKVNYPGAKRVPTGADWQTALQNAQLDEEEGGAYYWDPSSKLFWTWDTPEFIAQKFEQIVAAKKLGGVMAWSLAEDSYDWSHLAAIQAGVNEYLSGSSKQTFSQRRHSAEHKVHRYHKNF